MKNNLQNPSFRFDVSVIAVKVVITALFILCGYAVRAQDLIILRNGTEIDCKVQEVGPMAIKYNLPKANESFLRVVMVSEIFLVKYENGRKEVFNQEPADKPEETVAAVSDGDSEYAPGQASYGGPRIGVTFISSGIMQQSLIAEGKYPVITLFGWQFEKRLFSFDHGPSGIFEFVPLISGMEQGLFLPSLSTLIGIRGSGENAPEFAVGPTLAKTGLSMVFAFGITFKYRSVNFPVNIAYVPSVRKTVSNYDYNSGRSSSFTAETGHRVSLIFGFNVKKS